MAFSGYSARGGHWPGNMGSQSDTITRNIPNANHGFTTSATENYDGNPLRRLAATAAAADHQGTKDAPFPVKLHQLISHGDESILRWQSNGKSFAILDGDRLESLLRGRLYPQATIETFGRLLGLYGFQRIEQGPFAGDYYHPDFQKDYPEMAAKIETAGAAKNKLVLQEILTPALTSVRQFMQTLTCFPQKLHYFLSTGVHDLNLESVLSWKADGKAFVVYNAQEFESRGLSELFGFPGYTAFQMQLVHQYGFNQTKDDRLLDSADIYTHPQFVRDFPEWSVQIQRMQQPTGPKRKKKQQPHAVPSPVGTSTPNTSSGAASVASSVDEQHRALQPRNSTTSPESVSTDLAASAAPKRSKPRKRCRLAGEPMPKNYFPFKLHTVISLCEKLGYQHVVSWQPHGYCFLIHNQDEFIKHVLPLFRHSEYASFRAQLKAYGFSRLGKHGPDKGGYYNEYFLRCMPELCAHIIRRPKNQHGTVRGRPKGAVSRADPNFYDMKPMPKGKDKLPRVPVEGNLFELLQSELTYIEPPPVTEAAPPAMNISNNKSKAYQGEAVAMPSKLSESALPSFPKRLYSLLEYASDNNLGRMITWSNDGHSFVVINENAFAKELLSPWLDICSYAQFEQELRDHGFELGLDGHWKHNMFLQSLPHLCAAIKRKGKNQKRKLDVDDGVDESKKAARKASIDSPRSSATVMTMGMGNSEFEIAMLLTSLDKKKKDEVVAAVLPPKSASTVSSSSSGSGSSCDSNIHQPSRVAPLVIAPPAQKGPRKPAADPPGRRCSVYSE